MAKIKLWKVLEGPFSEDDSSEDHWLVCMATDSSCSEGQWFDFELMCPSFNSAYELKGRIMGSMEPVEIDLDTDSGVVQ